MSTGSSTEFERWPVNGIDFYVKQLYPPSGTETVAKLIFNHGFAEHVGRYDELFSALISKGIEVFCFDQRGAGNTSPLQKDWGLTNEQHVFRDLDYLIEKKIGPDRENESKVPWFMIGFSMGGGICLNYAIKGKYRDWFSGYIAIAPLVLIHHRTRPNPVIEYVLLSVAKLIPRVKYFTGLDFEYLSRDEASVQAVREDPLCHATGTFKQIADMLARGQKLLNKSYVSQIVNRPILVIHGTGDQINLYDASKQFVDSIPVDDKTLITIEGGYHELHHDTDKEKFTTDLTSWILDRSSKAKL
ncbi:Alpha/Beta hydrolase protein [Lipomyces japonicus]|uniref:Alpha/Beta hydrolase protein n=1 Tax=Lipomyces japonicus TaxID=56871 RepID=UPI0034CF4A86